MNGCWSRALALLVLAGSACADRPEEGAVAVRPPVLLDDQTVARVIAAGRAIQDLSRGHPLIQAGASEFAQVPGLGVGLATMLGDAGRTIVERHGFASLGEYESQLGHVQQAVRKIALGDREIFDTRTQEYRMNFAMTDLEEELKRVGKDATLSPADRRLEEARVRSEMRALEDRLADVGAIEDALDAQYDHVPAQNLEAVRPHLEELLALMKPIGAIPPPAGR